MMEQPNEPKFYLNESVLPIYESSSKDNSYGAVESETLQEMIERFNENNIGFICGEALKIYFRAENEETVIRALELLERAAQY